MNRKAIAVVCLLLGACGGSTAEFSGIGAPDPGPDASPSAEAAVIDPPGPDASPSPDAGASGVADSGSAPSIDGAFAVDAEKQETSMTPGVDAAPEAAPACVPHCPSGVMCGVASDGCGGEMQCGTCSGHESCGGGGTPGQCGCTPVACVSGQTCGTVPDNCGGTVDCGACGDGSYCNQGSCVPLVGCTSTPGCDAPGITPPPNSSCVELRYMGKTTSVYFCPQSETDSFPSTACGSGGSGAVCCQGSNTGGC